MNENNPKAVLIFFNTTTKEYFLSFDLTDLNTIKNFKAVIHHYSKDSLSFRTIQDIYTILYTNFTQIDNPNTISFKGAIQLGKDDVYVKHFNLTNPCIIKNNYLIFNDNSRVHIKNYQEEKYFKGWQTYKLK